MMMTATPTWAQNNTLKLPTPRLLGEWMTLHESLTKKIRARFPNVKMQLLSATAAPILKHESDFYQHSIYSHYWIRNILFYQENTPLVLGRSVIPCCNNSITATRGLLKLGAEPLGPIIFADPQTIRSQIHSACLTRPHPLINLAERYITQSINHLYARTSALTYKNVPLLITEAFLPELYAEPYEYTI